MKVLGGRPAQGYGMGGEEGRPLGPEGEAASQPNLHLSSGGPGPFGGQVLRAEFCSICLDIRKINWDSTPGQWQNGEGGRNGEEFGEDCSHLFPFHW